MTEAWRRRLSAEERAELDQWWSTMSAEAQPTELELEEAARRNGLEAARTYDESAKLEEELQVRLQGQLAEGQLPFDLGHELFKPLRDSVNAATSAHVDLALAGVLPGSTILRIKASTPIPDDESAGMIPPEELSASDRAVRALLEVIAEAEEGQDPRAWPPPLRAKLSKLADVLYKYELTAEFTWLASSGAMRRSQLTRRGQDFVRQLRQYTEVKRTVEVEGVVTGLRLPGWVDVKQEQSAAVRIQVQTATLEALQLTLWQQVHLEVEVSVRIDAMGEETTGGYRFLRDLPLRNGP